jgi:hypothetical protein
VGGGSGDGSGSGVDGGLGSGVGSGGWGNGVMDRVYALCAKPKASKTKVRTTCQSDARTSNREHETISIE